MGYYTGNGQVSSGVKEKRLFGTLLYNGGQHVYQTCVATVTRKRGVSLATAQAAAPSATYSKGTFSQTGDYPWMGINGTVKKVVYAQMGDSDLYDLTITEETLTGTASAG